MQHLASFCIFNLGKKGKGLLSASVPVIDDLSEDAFSYWFIYIVHNIHHSP